MSPLFFDLVVFGVVLISALLAALRGFTREILAIGSWVVAGLVAYVGYKQLTPYVVQQFPALKSPVPDIISGAGIFLVTLIIAYMLTGRISDMILDSRIGALDRTFGFIFGAARGLLLAVIAFWFFQFFAGQSLPAWVETAKTKPFLAASADKLKSYVPDDIDTYISKFKATRAGDAPADGDQPLTTQPITGIPNSPTPGQQKK